MKKDVIKAFRLVRYGMSIKGLKLARYGVSVKGNMVIMALFFVAGTVFALLPLGNAYAFSFMMSNVLILCAAMFPGQLLVSTDLSFLVQTSPYKKTIQTGMFAGVTFLCNFAALTWLLLIRLAAGMMYHTMEEEMVSFSGTGILLFLFAVCNCFIYKYFLLTVVGIYVCTMALTTGSNILFAQTGKMLLFIPVLVNSVHPAFAVVFAYGCVIAGSLLTYGISRLLYKRELSRLAFGAAMRR